MKRKIGGVTIECIQGDIADQSDIEAIVNAANAELQTGGGVAGAIHRRAGRRLARECRRFAPIQVGEAVITGAYNLPNKYVIHCLGPVYGKDTPSDKLLADCYRNVLKIADKKEVESIGFPAISTGAFGYPMEDAAQVAFGLIKEEAPKLKNIKKIRFVLFDESARRIHEKVLEDMT